MAQRFKTIFNHFSSKKHMNLGERKCFRSEKSVLKHQLREKMIGKTYRLSREIVMIVNSRTFNNRILFKI